MGAAGLSEGFTTDCFNVAYIYVLMCILMYVYVHCVSVVHALSVCSFVIALSVCLSQSNMLHRILHRLTFAACDSLLWSMHVVVASHWRS